MGALMAKCPNPNCNPNEFISEQVKVQNINQKLPFIVCAKCGTVLSLSSERVETALEAILRRLE
jgi:uncharacterized Zn finger protein